MVDIQPIIQGPQTLSSLLQIVLNCLVAGRVDIAMQILPILIDQLQTSGQ